MTPIDLRWNLIPLFFLLCQITYLLMFSWRILLWVIENKFFGQNLRFDLKWPHLCDLWIARKFQFSKSIFSKFWKILELEMKILINFSTPKNPNITFLDRSRNTQKSRCCFSWKPPILPWIFWPKIIGLFTKTPTRFHFEVVFF